MMWVAIGLILVIFAVKYYYNREVLDLMVGVTIILFVWVLAALLTKWRYYV